MPINIPETDQKRIVIVGAGFAGMTLARKIRALNYQVVLIDKNNYHQFQPLFYQVAMAGLEPSAISFPLRKMFKRYPNVHIRMCSVLEIDAGNKRLQTDMGRVDFDYLVLAMGVTTNYFGNESLPGNVYTLKSVAESLFLRNAVLGDLEQALTERDYDERQGLLDVVIVGGGPTGVELAGALSEMRKYVVPKEYNELDPDEIDIHLIQGAPKLLMGMSDEASAKAEKYLGDMGVLVQTGVIVTDYKDHYVHLNNGEKIYSEKVIWAAGVSGFKLPGLADHLYGPGNRLIVDEFNRLKDHQDVFVLGDQAIMASDEYQHGHPQVAQPAIQQARNLALNFRRMLKGQPPKSFRYKDLGSMATIGRNKAVCDLPGYKTQGFIAWVLWLVVHLKSILGVKNKLFVLLNWIWDYITYNPGLRIVIRHKTAK